MKESECPKRDRCFRHECKCIKQTTEEKLGIIKQPQPLCYQVDDIINIIKSDNNSLDEETITLLNELLEKLREDIMNLREWGQSFKYKTINLLEKLNNDKI